MPRTSPLRNRELLQAAVSTSTSKKEVLTKLGLRAAGGNYKALDKALTEASIEAPIFDYSKQATFLSAGNKFSDAEVFVENSTYDNRAHLKKRLLANGVKEECFECGQSSTWNNKPLTLQLEHINGVWNDNRLFNLCLLCPNCHSQTSSYAGRGTSRAVRSYACLDCGVSIAKGSTRCYLHAGEQRQTISYPPVEELIEAVLAQGFVKVGKDLGTSDIAVRKHLMARLEKDHPIFSRVGRRTLQPVIG